MQTADIANAPPDLRAALRHATAELHRHLDRAPDQGALLAPDITLERYATIMEKHRHALAIAEAALASLEQARPSSLPPYRPRLPALEADMAALAAQGHSTTRPDTHVAPSAEAAPAMDGVLACGRYLGTRYVLEGSTRGAAAIAPRLDRHLPTLSANAFDFWRLQAEEAPAWHALALTLAALPARGDLASAAIAAARGTFVVFLRAFGLDAPEPSRPHVADVDRVGVRR